MISISYFIWTIIIACFLIDDLSFNTAKGLQPGDSIEQCMLCLVKKMSMTLYKTSMYMIELSILIIFNADTREDKIDLCSISVNRWNSPDIFTLQRTSETLHADNIIQFNEDNFSKYFKFGMSKQAVEKKLTELGVRIQKNNLRKSTRLEIYGLY